MSSVTYKDDPATKYVSRSISNIGNRSSLELIIVSLPEVWVEWGGDKKLFEEGLEEALIELVVDLAAVDAVAQQGPFEDRVIFFR